MKANYKDKVNSKTIIDNERNSKKIYFQEPMRLSLATMNLTPFLIYNEDGSLNRFYYRNSWYVWNEDTGELVRDVSLSYEDGNLVIPKQKPQTKKTDTDPTTLELNKIGNRRGMPEVE